MAKLIWGAPGQRFYEAGVNRGVLFPKTGPGVAWNGLLSVNEEPSGGTPQPYYQDGIKYLNVATAEEFEATISALSAPKEFGRCDGTYSIAKGLFATQQPREPFGFSYVTLVGNDLETTDFGYKLHIVYNAMADPTARANNSLNDSPEPLELSWRITTLPVLYSPNARTAHIILDSEESGSYVMSQIEDILYGTESVEPRLPTIDEIVDIYQTSGAFEIVLNETTGFADLLTGGQDLLITSSAGIFAIAETTRLTETVDNGIYTLEI